MTRHDGATLDDDAADDGAAEGSTDEGSTAAATAPRHLFLAGALVALFASALLLGFVAADLLTHLPKQNPSIPAKIFTMPDERPDRPIFDGAVRRAMPRNERRQPTAGLARACDPLGENRAALPEAPRMRK